MSSGLPIYAALNVPTVSSYPSSNCLQWSGDGQACFVSKSAVYILTPDQGINFDMSSVLKAPIGKGDGNDKPLGWFRTMIECNRERPEEKPQNWPEISQEYGAVVLGSLDFSVKSASCSPSNITKDGRCILATLNSNMEVALWSASKNHLKGEWHKVQDVTAFLRRQLEIMENKSSLGTILQIQTTSIAWSCQPDFSMAPTPFVDASILATGNRAGSIMLLRYRPTPTGTDHVLHLETKKVSNSWIMHLAWSPWTATISGTCKAYLAFGSSDGFVGLLEVEQSLRAVPTASGFGKDYDVQASCKSHVDGAPEGDGRGITALSWVETPDRNLVLVHCTPGAVHLWPAPPLVATNLSTWSGTRTIFLQNQNTSAGSSALYPVSGLGYIPAEDVLILSLFDGSFHAIHGLTVEPSYSTPQDASRSITHHEMSKRARTVFSKSEKRAMTRADVSRMNGMILYDGSSTVIWAHEACRPTDFSYKHEAKHNSMLVVAQLWDDGTTDTLADDLSRILENATTASGSVPIHLLRPIFLHLSKRDRLQRIQPTILQVLRSLFADDSLKVIISAWSGGDLTPELKLDFRHSLKSYLFGWNDLLNLRMRLAVADLCWKYSSNSPEAQAECGQTAQHLLSTIAHWVLRTIIRHLIAVIPTITVKEVPYVLRIVVQGLLPGLPPDLADEAQELSARLNTAVPGLARLNAAVHGNDRDQAAAGLNESCPACHVDIPLVDITSALCDNGHAWARCSITSFILSTPMVRTCIGCSRKAFLPLSQKTADDDDGVNWLPFEARGWVVEELLEAVHRCLFCGNSFVSIL